MEVDTDIIDQAHAENKLRDILKSMGVPNNRHEIKTPPRRGALLKIGIYTEFGG